MTSRFVVGIDLGTTNCALAWVDTSADAGTPIHMQDIPQLVNPGEPGHAALLPSFLYIPGDIDFPAGSLALPWDPSPSQRRRRGRAEARRGEPVCGSSRPRSRGSRTAARAGRHRSCRGVRQPRSRTSRRSRRRLRTCGISRRRWIRTSLAASARSRWRSQDVLLTVPASFDEEARELTLQAAAAAGLDAGHAARGAAGRVLRLDRRPRRRLAQPRRASATWSSSATSAAAPPTSP